MEAKAILNPEKILAVTKGSVRRVDGKETLFSIDFEVILENGWKLDVSIKHEFEKEMIERSNSMEEVLKTMYGLQEDYVKEGIKLFRQVSKG